MYGSIEGVKENIPRLAEQITDSPMDALDIPESDVTSALEEYTAQVNAVIGGVYLLPVTGEQSQKIVASIVNNLAAYKIARRYWININSEENHELMALRKDANEIIKGLKSGSYVLPDQKRESLSDDIEIPDYDSTTYFNMEDPSTWQDKI